MKKTHMIARRDVLKAAGLLAAGAGLRPETLFRSLAWGERLAPAANAANIGRREIVKGLDGMSRVGDEGTDFFSDGHGAAAVISSAFFCRENNLDAGTQDAILSLLEARFLINPIYTPSPEEPADPELVDGLVKQLDNGINTLRRSGHNIIFATISLKALREVPEAATPTRVKGLRTMVQSFGTEKSRATPLKDKDSFVDLGDEKKFIRFIFAEYLRALDLYLNGKGHHGFAGHVLTVGHALVDLKRMGYPETARKGVEAYWQFIQHARDGADLGGWKVADSPPEFLSPLERDYWAEQVECPTGDIVSSHRIKYPYSFYALLKDLPDDELKQRTLQKLYHLTAVS
jgi:hypothetical protein